MAAEMTVSGLPLWQGEGILIVSLELETVEESFNWIDLRLNEIFFKLDYYAVFYLRLYKRPDKRRNYYK